MKHFLSLKDWGGPQIEHVLDRGSELARLWRAGKMPQPLAARRVGLWFYGNGFRNRLAFELGAKEMGASVAYVPGELGVHEPIEDVAGYLQNWFSMLVVRAKRHEDLVDFAARSSVPVINARTDKSHPCEIMGDLLYLREQRQTLDGLKVVFVGESSNLCMAWLDAATILPITVVQVCPEGYEVEPQRLAALQAEAAGQIHLTHNLDDALTGVDVIYTDCWPRTVNSDEQALVKQKFLPYQIAPRHLSKLSDQGVFLPCPPVTRGEEVSAEVMLSPRCMNHSAKDYLLHAQNAIMEAVAAN